MVYHHEIMMEEDSSVPLKASKMTHHCDKSLELLQKNFSRLLFDGLKPHPQTVSAVNGSILTKQPIPHASLPIPPKSFNFTKVLDSQPSAAITLSAIGSLELSHFRRTLPHGFSVSNELVNVPQPSIAAPSINTRIVSSIPPVQSITTAQISLSHEDDIPDSLLLDINIDHIEKQLVPTTSRNLSDTPQVVKTSAVESFTSYQIPSDTTSYQAPKQISSSYSLYTGGLPTTDLAVDRSSSTPVQPKNTESLIDELESIHRDLISALRVGNNEAYQILGLRHKKEAEIFSALFGTSKGFSTNYQSMGTGPYMSNSTKTYVGDFSRVNNYGDGSSHGTGSSVGGNTSHYGNYSSTVYADNTPTRSNGTYGEPMDSFTVGGQWIPPSGGGISTNHMAQSGGEVSYGANAYHGEESNGGVYDGADGGSWVSAQPYSTSSFPSSVPVPQEGAPLCACGLPSVLLTSRQEHSLDQQFYSCSQRNDGGCSFFQWLDPGMNNASAGAASASAAGAIRDYKSELHRRFGHRGFRHGQQECIDAAMQGRDVFCLMPTGGGKSMVYQLPSWCCAGVAVVFSPLISLIQDQVDALNAIGIRAIYLSSTQDNSEVQANISELRSYCSGPPSTSLDLVEDERRIKFLYITPEKFSKSGQLRNLLVSLARKSLLNRFIIDEAHCLSQWGHDFRPDYLELAGIRPLCPSVPIMALTATANQSVVRDCMHIIGMKNPFVHSQSFNRTNLRYFIRRKATDKKLVKDISEYVLARKTQTGIVYCLSRKDTEELAEELIKSLPPDMRKKITFYHAELSASEKERRQRLWSKGDIKLICATIAFGMGINKPDVRYVIHHSLPKSLTNYYQESGRAGRDGEPAECVLYFSHRDRVRLAHMIQRASEERGVAKSKDSTQRQLESLNKCYSYCLDEVECRRVMLLHYFGEAFPSEECRGTCDNCQYRGSHPTGVKEQDYSETAKVLLTLVSRVIEQGLPKMTMVKLAKLSARSKEKEIARYSHLVNALNEAQQRMLLPREKCERLLEHLLVRGFLDEEHVTNAFNAFGFDCLIMGPRAHLLMTDQERLIVGTRTMAERRSLPAPAATDDDGWISSTAAGTAASTLKARKTSAKKQQTETTPATTTTTASRKKSAAPVSTSATVSVVDEVNLLADGDSDSDDFLSIPQKRRRIMSTPRTPVQTTVASAEEEETESVLSDAQQHQLIKWLEEYRKRWSNYWNYLNNTCLREISRVVPCTLEQLAAIAGIGETKARNHGEGILATLYAFLESNNLLHLFPQMKKPTLEESPLWRNPMSEEAQALRMSSLDEGRSAVNSTPAPVGPFSPYFHPNPTAPTQNFTTPPRMTQNLFTSPLTDNRPLAPPIETRSRPMYAPPTPPDVPHEVDLSEDVDMTLMPDYDLYDD